MGYTIDYIGSFKLNKPLTEDHAKFLQDFAKTRHYHRSWKPEEENGKWFVDPEGSLEPDFNDKEYQNVLYAKPYDHEKRKVFELEKYGCIDLNEVNPGMPSFYCQWIPTEDCQGIEWDGNEKFYKAFDWLKFIIKHYLEPWGYILNGTVEIRYGSNEYPFENGILEVRDNEVTYDSDELYETLDEDEEEDEKDLLAIHANPKYKNFKIN